MMILAYLALLPTLAASFQVPRALPQLPGQLFSSRSKRAGFVVQGSSSSADTSAADKGVDVLVDSLAAAGAASPIVENILAERSVSGVAAGSTSSAEDFLFGDSIGAADGISETLPEGVVALADVPSIPEDIIAVDQPSRFKEEVIFKPSFENVMDQPLDLGKVDLGKEVITAALANSTSMDFFSDDIVSLNTQLNQVDINDLNINDMKITNMNIDQIIVEEEIEVVPAPDEDVSETVSAILAASGEAVAAAGAAFSEDLADQMKIFPTYTANDTDATATTSNTVASISSGISSPIETGTVEIIAPSSDVVGEPATSTEKIEAPSVSKIVKFAIPAVGVWLCGPLLSLIDTSAVGVLSGTVQQAALNPGVAVTDYAALLIAFMYTGTTNLIAAAQESDRTVPGKPRTTKTMIGALQLSTFVGLGLGTVLFALAPHLLRSIIGNDAISPAVFDAAMKYVRIRALGMPAATIIGTAQAACLGMQDIRSPLYVLVAAAVVNLLGDIIFVGSANPWIGGTAGAAWATVFSQYAGVAIFMRWLCGGRRHEAKKPPVLNLTKAIMEFTSSKPSDKDGENRRLRFKEAVSSFSLVNKGKGSGPLKRGAAFVRSKLQRKRKDKPVKADSHTSVRGFLNGKFRGRDLAKFPDRETVGEVAPYVLPVTTTQVGRVSGYVAMSHVVSSSLGTISMAAQQVIVSLFYCLTPIADSLSLTAQSFVPTIFEKKCSRERSKALGKTATNFLKAGAVFSAAMVAAVGLIPLLSGFFTSDPSVVALTNSVVPLLVGFFAIHGPLCSAEGLLMGQKDLGFLGKLYALYFAAVPYFMLRVKRAALAGRAGVNLRSVWSVFLSYQFVRTAVWLGRVALLQRRNHKQAQEAAEEEISLPPLTALTPPQLEYEPDMAP